MITHVTYKTWSGGVARGGPPFTIDSIQTTRHAERAVWLAGQVEAASWGTVQNYDGCGMSGGILHNTAVNHDNTQGTFFALLRHVLWSGRTSSAPGIALVGLMSSKGWVLTEDGVLRYGSTGRPIPGVAIRNAFSPPDGHVPEGGSEWAVASRWLSVFHDLFSDVTTQQAQIDYAISWMSAGAKDVENEVYQHYVDPHLDTWIGLSSNNMNPYLELAMCVYHAFSVNAPGIAVQHLRSEFSGKPSVQEFAKKLIRALGMEKYGNWHDHIGDVTDRYDRIRLAVWAQPTLWALALSRELMPENFSTIRTL